MAAGVQVRSYRNQGIPDVGKQAAKLHGLLPVRPAITTADRMGQQVEGALRPRYKPK